MSILRSRGSGCPGFLGAKVFKDVLRRGNAVGVALAVVGEAFFLEPLFDQAVIDDGRIAPGAHAEAEVVLVDQHADLAAELCPSRRG